MRTTVVNGIEVVWHGREDWLLDRQTVSGPAFEPDAIEADIWHWPGIVGAWVPPADTASFLRWTQDIYESSRGYDIGYNWCNGVNPPRWESPTRVLIDWWAVRGHDFRCAANNGDKDEFGPGGSKDDWNRRTDATIMLCSPAAPPTDAQIETARWGRAVIDVELGRPPRPLRPHSDSDWTSCCGDDLRARLHEIAVAPTPPRPTIPPPPPGEDMLMLVKCEGLAAVYRTNGVVKTFVANADDGATIRWVMAEAGYDTEVREVPPSQIGGFGPIVGPRPDSVDVWGRPA